MAKFKSKAGHSKLRTFRPSKREVPAGSHLLRVQSLADDGRGIAVAIGESGRVCNKNKRVFVAGALPGELITARYTSVHKDYDQADLLAIKEASADRVIPECHYYQQCGGCSLQHLDYSQQLRHKQQRLASQFRPLLANENIISELILSAPPAHYRHRARFAVSANRDGLSIGFRQRESHNLVDIDRCHIVYESINQQLPMLKTLISVLRKRKAVTELTLVEDSAGKHGVLLNCKTSLPDDDIESLRVFAHQQSMSINIISANQPEIMSVWPLQPQQFEYRLDSYDVSLPFAVNDFTQVNPVINQQLIATALEWLELTDEDIVADFFCGIGNFSLPLAQLAASVTGYELVPAMVAKAVISAEVNGIDNATFHCRNLMSDKVNVVGDYNKAVLDPPRSGALSLCQQIGGWVLGILYISRVIHPPFIVTLKNYLLLATSWKN
nr:23S rRNA (uracil(1939)-C(5))-methyltransferase RlmD [Oceanicoccus sp. KOV_DT_Chl]